MAKVNKTCSQEVKGRLSTLRSLTESPYYISSVLLGEVRVAEFRSCRLGNVSITTLAQAIMPVSKGGSGAMAHLKVSSLHAP